MCSSSAAANLSAAGKRCTNSLVIESGFHYWILRPGLVYGQHDHTDRLYYWLYQVKHNSKILIPEDGKRTLSETCVDDTVQAIIRTMENDAEKHSDIFNVISSSMITIEEIVRHTVEASGNDPEIISADAEFH